MSDIDPKKQYDPAKIESKWQKKWAASKVYKSKESPKKDKYYILDMFPYPSGEGLHVGHPKGYIATDVVSRMKRMQGHSVLHPMGFDAFGLPAENYALKTRTNPADSVNKNVERYKKQLEILGFDYDWSREINTTDPKYYKWTQWIFLQMWKKGLAYESYEPINWCPSCKTGLANEDIENGRCERCGTVVEKKPMRQWVLKITDYADRLLKDLDAADNSNMPHIIDKKWPPRPGKKQVERRTIHALVRDPKTGKFLGLKWKKFPWITFIVGGVEDGEDIVEAAKREIIEETGYTDLKSIKILGNPVKAEYFAAHKDQNRLAITSGILFELASDARKEIEQHEKDAHESIWMAPKDMNAEIMTCAELPVWLERLADLAKCNDSGKLLDWPESIKTLQRNWIGRSEGAEIKFKVKSQKSKVESQNIKVFTTRPDTLFGVTYVVLAPEHKLVSELIADVENKKEVEDYIDRAKNESEIERADANKEKTGAELKGVKAINPANNEEVPIWIADYVLADYGTGAVMAVPAHDERDYKFAKKFNLPIKKVIDSTKHYWQVGEMKLKLADQILNSSPGILVNSDQFNGKDSESAKKEITLFVGGKWVTKYKLRDWVFSRQRYWGEPIPMVHCARCGAEELEGQAKIRLSFYDKDAWKELSSGKKTIETRALNPEEPDRYFKNVKVGDIVACIKKNEKSNILDSSFRENDKEDKLIVRVKSTKTFGSLYELFADKKTLERVSSKRFKTLVELAKWYNNIDENYVQKINDYGLIAWEIEPVTIPVPVPEKDLPVKLPKVKSYEPTGTGESPLAAISKWVNTKCPVCNGPAKRETNTMPQWAGSSWYYLRYEDPKNAHELVGGKNEKYWSPVDLYVGGAEHATRHLIYARFWHKLLYDIGAVSAIEPFIKLQSVGLIMGEDGRKMSKRFGNVVNPDLIVKTYGADTLRIYEMFMGPFDQQIAWSTSSMVGARRFIERVWKLKSVIVITPAAALSRGQVSTLPERSGGKRRHFVLDEKAAVSYEAVNVILNKATKKVTEDIELLKFNTAISALMITVNKIEKIGKIGREQFETLLKLLAPFAPHFTEELWAELGNKKSIHISKWPEFDPGLSTVAGNTIMVQVNGKVRGSFTAKDAATEDELKDAAIRLKEVSKWLEGREIKKIIVIKGKIVSIVCA